MSADHPTLAEQPNLAPVRQFGLAALFGITFGFLLQKGGVAKFHILIGMLLFQDFTVIKVMLSAIVTGMIGVFTLRAFGKIELQPKRTRLGANGLGGLIFGIGFACSGYCPGTGAAALGQNNWDAIFMVLGMITGSYAFAWASASFARTLKKWGDRGELLLPELFHVRLAPFVAIFGSLLIGSLWLLEFYTRR
jgi:uncharacterized membrane protein YedE/YeeE